LAEEILWAGDLKTADKLKSGVTAAIQIERKHGAIRQILNRLHIMMTTNHDHAVSAGAGDRRLAVYDVSDEHACDKTWFQPLHRDLENGGVAEFLYLLKNLKLGDWHPRQMLKTAETVEQQRMSADSVSQWAQACIDADAIVGVSDSMFSRGFDLGQPIKSEDLRLAYAAYCRQHTLRAVNENLLGKAMRRDVRPPYSQQASDPPPPRSKRPWAYHVPDGDTWQEKLDARLGIRK
jgi:hypothetical protein